MNDNTTKSMIQKACELLYPLVTIHNIIGFTNYFEGGIIEG
jgi:hypothetical protein